MKRIRSKKITTINYNLPGRKLVRLPRSSYEDPIYVSLSQRLIQRLNLGNNFVLNVSYEDISGYHDKSMFLLSINDNLELVVMRHWLSGLDGSGSFYEFDIPYLECKSISDNRGY